MFKRIIAMLILILALPAVLLGHGGSHKKVMGTISKVEAAKIHITTTDRHDVDVALTSKTHFTKMKKKAAATDAKVGMRVVVELSTDGKAETVHLGKMTATPLKTP